jgi:hypothetical protein
MKTSTIPPVRVQPALRQELEDALHEGETLAGFVESAVRDAVFKRKAQAEFLRRGIEAIERTKAAEDGVPVDEVLQNLQSRLEAAKATKASRSASAKATRGR